MMELVELCTSEILRYFTEAGSNRRLVMLGAMLLGICGGVLGTFALLRRQSLLGDAMAHAALPGVCLAFMLTHEKNLFIFLIGASLTGLLGAWMVTFITRHSRIKNDTAIGLVLSVFFGAGIVLLTVVQKSSAGNQSGLDHFLFGKAASLLQSDIYIMSSMSLLLVFLIYLFYKEFKILSFDPEFGASIGFPMPILDIFLTSLVVMAVMVGLQAVGVVLMVAILIIPAAAARQWTNQLGKMIVISAFVGALSGVMGAFFSTMLPKMPTGPVMVIAASMVLIISLFFAPNRGIIPTLKRRHHQRKRIGKENCLKAMYKICETNKNWEQHITTETMIDVLQESFSIVNRKLRQTYREGWIILGAKGWQITTKGLEKAQNLLRNHRLWELYLTRQMDIAIDHVHRDAEEIEHILTPQVVKQLESLLDNPTLDPHGKPIPR